MERYHYVECGLDGVYLLNGFRLVDTPHGRGVSIEHVDDLHKAIGRTLARSRKKLGARVFRFLRHEMDLSQSGLARVIGANEQAIGRWEKGKARIPGTADRLIRVLYCEHVGNQSPTAELLEWLVEIDEHDGADDELSFVESDRGWQQAAA